MPDSLSIGRTGRAGADSATGDRYPDGTRASLLPKPLARGAEAHDGKSSRINRFVLLNVLAEMDSRILHAPQVLEVIAEESTEGRPRIILAQENEWWRKKKK